MTDSAGGTIPLFIEGRIDFVVRLLGREHFDTAVDLGSRSNSVLPLTRATRRICVDLHDFSAQSADAHDAVECVQHDLEMPLPFSDRSHALILCMDVIEHVEKKQQLCREILRISRGTIVLSLPNTQNISYVLGLFRGCMSKQYRFNVPDGTDRHKWVPVYSDSQAFIQAAFKGCAVQSFDLYSPGLVSSVMKLLDPCLPGVLRRWARRLFVRNQVWLIKWMLTESGNGSS